MKVVYLLLVLMASVGIQAQSIDPVSLLLAKAIKAVDLKVQRMQNETLVLQRSQQLAEHELTKVKLNEIRNWQKQLSDLYAGYYAELKQVKPVVSSGVLVKTILSFEEQVQIEYRRFAGKAEHAVVFKHSKEIRGMLADVLSSQLSMNDADRLKMLYTLKEAMSRCLERILELNKQQLALVEQREMMKRNLNDVKRLHGIQ